MIETANLQLIPCGLSCFEAFLENEDDLASLLQVSLADDWLNFPDAREAMMLGYEYLSFQPSAFGWWTYLFVYTANQTLIGMGGFKGVPDEKGIVEIGYSIAPSYTKRGLAAEAARGLIKYAFSHSHVKRVDAQTLPGQNASTRVLEKIGMKHIGIVHDVNDGEVWHWSLSEEDYQKP